MSNNNLYRVGGVAVFLSIVLLFGAYTIPVLFAIGMLLLAVFYFALSRLFGAESSALMLAALASVVLGAIVLLVTGVTPSVLFNVGIVLAWMLPALLAGWVAKGNASFPRIPAILGIVGGVLGILNAIINILGGGDYTKLTDPTLSLLSNVTYIPASLFVLIWFVWSGIVLLRRKS